MSAGGGGLREIRSARADGARWWQGEGMDLFVWQDATGAISDFQLSIEEYGQAQSLSWRRGAGFSVLRVDAEREDGGHHARSPLLVAGGALDLRALLRRFDEASLALDGPVRVAMMALLREAADQTL